MKYVHVQATKGGMCVDQVRSKCPTARINEVGETTRENMTYNSTACRARHVTLLVEYAKSKSASGGVHDMDALLARYRQVCV